MFAIKDALYVFSAWWYVGLKIVIMDYKFHLKMKCPYSYHHISISWGLIEK